jgi:RecJ-like exonuclease
MESTPPTLAKCDFCGGSYAKIKGASLCPRCKRPAEKSSQDKSLNSAVSKNAISPFLALPERSFVSGKGRDLRSELKSKPTASTPGHIHTAVDRFKSEKGKPSDHRPTDSSVCYHCNGKGVVERRTCSICRGAGYIFASRNNYEEARKLLTSQSQTKSPQTVYPNKQPGKTRTSIFGQPKKETKSASIIPWYQRLLPPQTRCRECYGEVTLGVKKCPSCHGSGVDTDPIDPHIEAVMRKLFAKGWRPYETAVGLVFNINPKYPDKKVNPIFWEVLHQLNFEKRASPTGAAQKAKRK